jgi:hypothetical protein
MSKRLQTFTRVSGIMLLCAFILSGCIKVVSVWRVGIETVCLLLEISDLPAKAQAKITIRTSGGGGAQGKTEFMGGNGFHKICVPIPGNMPGETSPLTVNVFETDPSDPSKEIKKNAVDGTVGGVSKTAPTLPSGTITH